MENHEKIVKPKTTKTRQTTIGRNRYKRRVVTLLRCLLFQAIASASFLSKKSVGSSRPDVTSTNFLKNLQRSIVHLVS